MLFQQLSRERKGQEERLESGGTKGNNASLELCAGAMLNVLQANQNFKKN